MRYDESRLISLSDPRENFSVLIAQSGNHPVRGALSLTVKVLLWDQSTAPPIENEPVDFEFQCRAFSLAVFWAYSR